MTKPEKHVLIALRYAIKPLLRLALRHGIQFKDLSNLLKNAIVEESVQEARDLHTSEANSRISLITGIDRKEVSAIKTRLKNNTDDIFETAKHRIHRITKILSAWQQSDEYCDSNGVPLLLRKRSGSPNLTSLVKTFSGDIPSSQIINEMMRVNAIEKTLRGYYRPLKPSYDPLPLAEEPEYLVRIGQVLNDLGRTVVYNAHRDSGEVGLYEKRTTAFVDRDKLPEFQRIARTLSNSLLETINAWLETNRVRNGDEKGIRMGVGVFSVLGGSEGS